ncbi:hypothetical protein Tco_0950511 [Tanacetum coccineum]
MEDDSPLPYDHLESPEYKRLMASYFLVESGTETKTEAFYVSRTILLFKFEFRKLTMHLTWEGGIILILSFFIFVQSSDQEKLKKMVTVGDHSSKEREGDDEPESDTWDLKKLEEAEMDYIGRHVTISSIRHHTGNMFKEDKTSKDGCSST